jgi:hypothetical protein
MVALLVAAGLTVAAPAHACACGGVVDQPGQDTSVGSETAVVVWDGTKETIELRLSTRTQAVTAGLLVPTPSPATVALGDETVFDDLVELTRPRHETRRHLFGPALLFGGGGDDGSAGAPGTGIEVSRPVDLGPLRATTLTAADGTALDTWLRNHGFDSSPDLATAVKPYLDDGWSFVAIQLSAASQDLDGDLPPIAMTFQSDRAVYPMRMSTIATQAQQPTVYVLSHHRMERTDPVAEGPTRPELFFAGRVVPTEVSSPSLKQWLASTPYLTATTQWLPDPTKIVSDFTFDQAPTDATYHLAVYDDTYLVPADVGTLVILVLLVGLGWLVVRVVRR